MQFNMWHGIAFSCAFDLHLQSTGIISITTSMTSPSHGLSPPTIATLSDKVKQLHGVKVTRGSYNNNEITIWLLPVAVLIDLQVMKFTKHDHCIHYHKSHLGHTISQTLQKQVRRPLLSLCNFYVASMGHEIESVESTQSHNSDRKDAYLLILFKGLPL